MPINFDWFDLNPYKNKYFVETGMFKGEGAMKALSSGAFEQVITIEVNRELVDQAMERFRLMTAAGMLKIVHSDSAHLWDHICELQHPITFFLDAHGHWSACTSKPEKCQKERDALKACPLMEELDAIQRHPLARQHTILIDDRRCLQPDWDHPTQSWWKGLSEEAVLRKLHEINPEFKISFTDGLVPADIIVAAPS